MMLQTSANAWEGMMYNRFTGRDYGRVRNTHTHMQSRISGVICYFVYSALQFTPRAYGETCVAVYIPRTLYHSWTDLPSAERATRDSHCLIEYRYLCDTELSQLGAVCLSLDHKDVSKFTASAPVTLAVSFRRSALE